MQIICTDKKVRKNIVQDLKDINSQSFGTQAKKENPSNESMKKKIGSHDEKWLDESTAKLLKQFDDDKRANLSMSRMQNETNYSKENGIIYDKIWHS